MTAARTVPARTGIATVACDSLRLVVTGRTLAARLLAVTAVLAALLLAAAAPAWAGKTPPSGSGLKLTVVARVCPDYADITGNRARNNIQESLRDLGADTAYVEGQPIDPTIEAAKQPNCKPLLDPKLPNWSFTLGTGFKSRAVAGSWGSLSIVTGAFSPGVGTLDSVPLLDTNGAPTGGTIESARTIELTKEQAAIAAKPNSLWIQGGTVTDPILNATYPGEYGFGALRCAIDNLNGDNVEWISYPLGATHVFCYAYYVQPPPTSGTIIVKKQVDAPAGTASQSFRFVGNISFATDQSFTLSAAPGKPGSATFYRAEGGTGTEPWSFQEQIPDGWELTGLTCVSKSGTSTSATDVATGKASVTLAAADVVTCTYTDRPIPPKAGLTLRKITFGGTGIFDFDVSPDKGKPVSAKADVEQEGVVTDAEPNPLELDPGRYTIDEDPPVRDDGRWSLRRVTCNGDVVADIRPVRLSFDAGDKTSCTFENRFIPKGSIKLRKITTGGVGTVGFVIIPVSKRAPANYTQYATTKREGEAVLATGSDTSALRLGRYDIQETTPNADATGSWRLDQVICNGDAVPSDQGRIRVTLTPKRPHLDCTFSDAFSAGPKPPVPPEPPGPLKPPDPTPLADLKVTKRPSSPFVQLGNTLSYRVVITNRGPFAARNVTVVEQRGPSSAIVSVRPSRYTCARVPLPGCVIGTLQPGQRVVLNVLVKPKRLGRVPNRAVVNTASQERTTRNNVARASIRVLRRFTGCPPAGRARAARRGGSVKARSAC